MTNKGDLGRVIEPQTRRAGKGFVNEKWKMEN